MTTVIGDMDISRGAWAEQKLGDPGTSLSPVPALRLAKSSPYRPHSRYLSRSLFDMTLTHSLSVLVSVPSSSGK